jgi:hypothetical protein
LKSRIGGDQIDIVVERTEHIASAAAIVARTSGAEPLLVIVLFPLSVRRYQRLSR